ncbi:MAG: hypothetical protein Q4D41_10835, partial [Prevotellaceae bacterium]|nr:hypothetical protein [Prevotellaceae bacterium]
MEEFKHVFFKPHVGDNHQNRLILLSTIWCPHNEDNEKPCPFYNDCTGGNSRGHNNECCYPNGKGNDEYKPLDMSFI